ncbi:Hypothetical protein (Fragment) [Durusdinium trenchii]
MLTGMFQAETVSSAPTVLNWLRNCESSPLRQGTHQEAAAHALVVVELLDGQGLLDNQIEVAFARLWQQPALECLLKLQQVALSGKDHQLQEPILQRQTSLGRRFHLFDASEQWQPQARWLSRLATLSNILNPVSMELAAWIAAVLNTSEGVFVRSRIGYYGDGPAGEGRLIPAFVGHDRAAHAERLALLRLLIAVEDHGS